MIHVVVVVVVVFCMNSPEVSWFQYRYPVEQSHVRERIHTDLSLAV